MTLSFFWDRFSKAEVYASFIAGLGSTILWVVLGFDTEIMTVRLISFPIAFIAAIIASLVWPKNGMKENHENN
jgi:sodium/proline symporter